MTTHDYRSGDLAREELIGAIVKLLPTPLGYTGCCLDCAQAITAGRIADAAIQAISGRAA